MKISFSNRLMIVCCFIAIFSTLALSAKAPLRAPKELVEKYYPPPAPKVEPKPEPIPEPEPEPVVEPEVVEKTAFCAWHLPGDVVTVVKKGEAIPFNVIQVEDGQITNSQGVFKISKAGVYLVTYGVVSIENTNLFELQLSDQHLPGGKLVTLYDKNGLDYRLNTCTSGALTVMFKAQEGDILSVVNVKGSDDTTLGLNEPGSVAAYISILEVRQ